MNESVERQLEQIRNSPQNALTDKMKIQFEARVRHKKDPESSIRSLKKQMMREMAQALQGAESRVKFLTQKANQRYQQHQKRAFRKDEVKQYNELVKLCEKARWEYLVQRQCCGFTINSHELVMGMFPLPPILE